MKNSKILKILSYITIPILIASLALSIISITAKENVYYNKERYFQSGDFATEYMSFLRDQIYRLIHYNSSYESIKDGENEIFFANHLAGYYSYDIKNRYFLIMYNNKALTNVELTANTSTIEGIKAYIGQNPDSKKVNIIYGDLESDSEIIQKTGSQYFDYFTEAYYSIQLDETTGSEITTHTTTNVKDFQIYSSYVEDFAEGSQYSVISKMLEKLAPFEQYSYFIIPVSTVLLILIIIYLIMSIGHKKDSDKITLNDFDKIPLELIIFFAITIGVIPFAFLSGINDDYRAIISIVITACLVVYILSIITLYTIIKRIKAREFLNTTITGKVLKWCWKIILKIYKKITKTWKTITYSTPITKKVYIYSVGFVIISLFILWIFGGQIDFATFIMEILLICFVTYKILKFVKDFSQIENKLKEMYEGNNQTELQENEFSGEMHNVVNYINDISNGFENAIQDRMKSERMKAELITNVSHDIKTPLTSIINYVDLLKQENIENNKAKEYIEILDNKSQRLKRLTEDLVEASKISTGNISLNLEKLNILELLKQAVGEFEDKFEKKNLSVIIDCKSTEINIMADSRYMFRVIENLFSNISKYALENSRVYIDVKENGENVLIEVKNISKDRLNISAEELMQRFVRGDKSRTTEGSGLGLSIAQNLTELQQGRFTLKLDGDLFKVELEFKMV